MIKTGSGRKRASPTEVQRSRVDEFGADGGPDEAAVFIAETTAELARLARTHKLLMLDFLLGMVRLEAEERVRLRSKCRLS